MRNGTRFPDAVARTAWPVELHDHGAGYHWHVFPEDHVHYVPLGSLIPAEADNIVAAGRCIDADTAALSSVRVMGPCIAMGAAAAHALDLAGSGSVQQIDVGALTKRLHDNLERRREQQTLVRQRMKLTDAEKAMFDGTHGKAKQKAMDLLVRYGEALNAERLVRREKRRRHLECRDRRR